MEADLSNEEVSSDILTHWENWWFPTPTSVSLSLSHCQYVNNALSRSWLSPTFLLVSFSFVFLSCFPAPDVLLCYACAV
jgi:hypothetical protein